MKIYLHIGAPRTGTTTLQALLHLNQKTLYSMGLDYPKIGYTDQQRGDAQHNLAFSLMDEYPAFVPEHVRVPADKVWKEFAAYARKSNRNIIVSSEAFSTLSTLAIAKIRDYLRDFDVEVLYVARDARSWHDSMARQQIKQFPYRTSLPAPFVGQPDSISEKQTRCWIECGLIPTIFPYDRTVVQRLLAHVGIDESELTPVPKRNDSLPMPVLNLLMQLNGIEIPHQNRGRLNRTIEGWWFELARSAPDGASIAQTIRSADETGIFQKQFSLKHRILLTASDIKRGLLGQPRYSRSRTTKEDGQTEAEAELLQRICQIGLDPFKHADVTETVSGWIDAALHAAD